MLAVHVQEHWGVQRTLQQVQKYFYWPGWRNDTSIFVTECAGCLHRENINLKDVVPHEDRAKNVNDVLCIDLVGPISLSANKNKYILSLMDQISRYVCAVALPDKSAKTVSAAIMGSWISLYGAPHNPNGPGFRISQLFVKKYAGGFECQYQGRIRSQSPIKSC